MEKRDRAEAKEAIDESSRAELSESGTSLFRAWILRKLLGVGPELANRHTEIVTDRSHDVAANVCHAPFDLTNIVRTVT